MKSFVKKANLRDRRQAPAVVRRSKSPLGELADSQTLRVEVDGRREQVVLEATKELVLRCGKASLTLTADGKIVIKGAAITSTSSGPHRIRGGSVSIN